MEQSYKRVRRVQQRKKGKGKKEERRKEIGERIGEKVEVEPKEERRGKRGGSTRGQWARLTFPRCLLAARPPLACYSTVRSYVMRATLSSRGWRTTSERQRKRKGSERERDENAEQIETGSVRRSDPFAEEESRTRHVIRLYSFLFSRSCSIREATST